MVGLIRGPFRARFRSRHLRLPLSGRTYLPLAFSAKGNKVVGHGMPCPYDLGVRRPSTPIHLQRVHLASCHSRARGGRLGTTQRRWPIFHSRPARASSSLTAAYGSFLRSATSWARACSVFSPCGLPSTRSSKRASSSSISRCFQCSIFLEWRSRVCWKWPRKSAIADRKSTRLNSSHLVISYAVFCLKKKKTKTEQQN